MTSAKKQNKKANTRVPDSKRYMTNGISALLRSIKKQRGGTESIFADLMCNILSDVNSVFKPLDINVDRRSLLQYLNNRHLNKAYLDFRLLVAYAKAAECHNVNLQLLAQMASMEARGYDKEHQVEFLDTIISLAKSFKAVALKSNGRKFTTSDSETAEVVKDEYEIDSHVFDMAVKGYKNRKGRGPNIDLNKLL